MTVIFCFNVLIFCAPVNELVALHVNHVFTLSVQAPIYVCTTCLLFAPSELIRSQSARYMFS